MSDSVASIGDWKERRRMDELRADIASRDADLTLHVWVNDSGEIICHEVKGTSRTPFATGDDRFELVARLHKAASRVALGMYESSDADGVSEGWKVEPVFSVVQMRKGHYTSMPHSFWQAESSAGRLSRLRCARWLLRAIVFGLKPILVSVFDLVFRPGRLRSLPVKDDGVVGKYL